MAGRHALLIGDVLRKPARDRNVSPERKGEQIVRYNGHYSNVSRGKRQTTGNDDAVPYLNFPI
ncbi:MAG TPA: hypothetical protein PLU95_06890 [Syntrophales bacterium]|nr:hypothetical protein [Syntrophales bacterium]HPN09011.1 hypothetical protein [Syntrophales bacterium]HQK78609.1 hypothetical protein [Syntrophales bacterium]